MNIEQYRALKAEEEQRVKEEPTPTPPVEDNIPEEPVEATPDVVEKEDLPADTETKPEPAPQTFEIDGEEVTIEELRNGYLRQSDYTKKTQEVSSQRKEAERAMELYRKLESNPELLNQVKGNIDLPGDIDPAYLKVYEMEAQLYEMKLDRDIETLTNKYPDFEVLEVLEMAEQKNITNLEDAYHLVKGSKGYDVTPEENVATETKQIDVASIKEELRQELLAELQKEDVSTRTIISSGGGAPTPKRDAKLSEGESRVASGMGLSKEEYIKWRDADNK